MRRSSNKAARLIRWSTDQQTTDFSKDNGALNKRVMRTCYSPWISFPKTILLTSFLTRNIFIFTSHTPFSPLPFFLLQHIFYNFLFSFHFLPFLHLPPILFLFLLSLTPPLTLASAVFLGGGGHFLNIYTHAVLSRRVGRTGNDCQN